ncbi:hypothetical protein PFICI_14801 [Pestalotiopsis fici W106-1]|uniref:Cytochrome P450 n=1 Tax=Pestalotiopsis fici (strain W106-1 / CGMCC3.15140) TaxID=1229662 RepID=W3WIV8_PESFW|nr:uncharacterized protein PFICI_14801 [Pestalotiopsis fici W106-1]ETS73855.1 hypothetical protein PFICI_14801 [Pestalotiopsis fici W106-1]
MLRPILLAAIALLATYLYNKLRYKRLTQHAKLPQLPPSLLLGHLKTLDKLIKRGPADRHPDVMFSEMHESLGSPPLMFVDLRPVNRPMVLVSSYEVAEQISKASQDFPTSIPKTDLSYMSSLTGPTSILHAHGDEWKALRKRYNPAFAPQHLMTLLPCIVDRIPKFIQHLDTLVKTGNEFAMVSLVTNLTFDIIGAVVMDVDLEAQPEDPSQQGELVRLYVELYSTFWDDKANFPWWMIPKTTMKRNRLEKRVNVLLDDMLRRKFAEHKTQGSDQSRSILSLSLQDATDLTPELLNETRDQIKTFLLAGHDTSSITLSWVFYWLSRNPHALNAVREELDNLLGPDSDPETIYAKLLSPDGPDLIRRMSYISAVLKETLRLHPPAATARYVKQGTGFTVRAPDGNDYCLDDMIIYNCEGLIQRDPTVYGESYYYFKPERWLVDAANSTIPAGAWRPFERGPRNCIGQDFAMIELRIIIAIVARRYDFVKVGLGELSFDGKGQPILNENGILVAKSEVYSTRQVNSKPVDGMKMKVKMASKSH